MYHLGVAGQRRGAEPLGLAAHPLQHVVGRVHALLGGLQRLPDQVGAVQVSPRDVETAARRLAAAGTAY